MGDLLTFPTACQGQVLELGPDRPGVGVTDLRLRLRSATRFGLRRGTSAARWYDTGCRLEGSDPVKAADAYERALAGCPGFADAHNNLGRLLHDADKLAEAESSYRLAICADGTVALYWFNLGVALEDQGRHAEAITAYERAIEIEERGEAPRSGDAAAPAGGNRDSGPEVHECSANAHFNLARLLELAGRRRRDHALMQLAVRHLLRYRRLTATRIQAR